MKGFFTCELWYYSSDNFVSLNSIAGHINLYIICILCDCFAKRICKTSGTLLWIFQIQILHYSGCWGVCFCSPFTFILRNRVYNKFLGDTYWGHVLRFQWCTDVSLVHWLPIDFVKSILVIDSINWPMYWCTDVSHVHWLPIDFV